jgi:hypothetical protein
MQWNQVYKVIVSVCLIMKLIYQFLFKKKYSILLADDGYNRENDFVSRAAGELRNSSERFRIWAMPRQEL